MYKIKWKDIILPQSGDMKISEIDMRNNPPVIFSEENDYAIPVDPTTLSKILSVTKETEPKKTTELRKKEKSIGYLHKIDPIPYNFKRRRIKRENGTFAYPIFASDPEEVKKQLKK